MTEFKHFIETIESDYRSSMLTINSIITSQAFTVDEKRIIYKKIIELSYKMIKILETRI